MSDPPLHEFIDMEAYDVVPGSKYRELREQLARVQEERDLLWEALKEQEPAATALKVVRDE